MWANWTAAFGVLIELVGFTTLAYELWQGTKSTVADVTEVARQKTDLLSLIGSDGDDGGIALDGGALGALLSQVKSRDDEMHRRMGLVLRGVIISGIGCAIQVVGSFGQALIN